MASYATPAQLANHMGVLAGFAAAQTARATQLLEDATGVINDELGFTTAGEDILSAVTTVTLDGTGTKDLVLPRHPVTAVATVVEIDSDGVEKTLVFRDDFTWSAAGILTRVGGVWPCHHRSVRVTDTAGLTAVPVTVRKICCRLSAAVWPNPGGADMEDIGDRRVRWHTPGMELSVGEKHQLDPYRIRQ